MPKVMPTGRSKLKASTYRSSPMPEREPGTQGVGGHWPDFPDPMEHTESDAYGAGDNLINDESAVAPSRRVP